jgi:hypothetical protein
MLEIRLRNWKYCGNAKGIVANLEMSCGGNEDTDPMFEMLFGRSNSHLGAGNIAAILEVQCRFFSSYDEIKDIAAILDTI